MSESDGVDVDGARLLRLVVGFLSGDLPQELASLAYISSVPDKLDKLAPCLIPVAQKEEQAWSTTCSPLRLPDNDGEGTREIPSSPGLGPPNSPEPVSFFPFIVLSIMFIVKCWGLNGPRSSSLYTPGRRISVLVTTHSFASHCAGPKPSQQDPREPHEEVR